MKLIANSFNQRKQKVFSRESGSGLDPEALKELARGIATTHPGELSCDECFEQMDRFVEVTLAGKSAAEAMPLVQDHLSRCRDCREEFKALLAALQAVA
jgi:hypothetical protein